MKLRKHVFDPPKIDVSSVKVDYVPFPHDSFPISTHLSLKLSTLSHLLESKSGCI